MGLAGGSDDTGDAVERARRAGCGRSTTGGASTSSVAPSLGAPAAEPPPAPAARPEAQDAAAAPERMIVRSGRLGLRVANMAAGLEGVTALVRRLDGYVASTSVRESDNRQTATLALRVPGGRYDDAVDELRRLAVHVDEESSTGQDVTEEFADLGAQLRNQEAAEVQYLELLKRAQSVEDVLKVQARLTEVRTQIERLKGRQLLLQRRAEMAKIELTLVVESAVFSRSATWRPRSRPRCGRSRSRSE